MVRTWVVRELSNCLLQKSQIEECIVQSDDKCEVCGRELEFRREGSVQGFYCKSCDWAVVTTYIPEIQLDETIYELRVSGADFHNENHVRTVSAVSGLNFIAARKLLQQQEKPLVFAGKAPTIQDRRDKLAAVGFSIEISPPFRY